MKKSLLVIQITWVLYVKILVSETCHWEIIHIGTKTMTKEELWFLYFFLIRKNDRTIYLYLRRVPHLWVTILILAQIKIHCNCKHSPSGRKANLTQKHQLITTVSMDTSVLFWLLRVTSGHLSKSHPILNSNSSIVSESNTHILLFPGGLWFFPVL